MLRPSPHPALGTVPGGAWGLTGPPQVEPGPRRSPRKELLHCCYDSSDNLYTDTAWRSHILKGLSLLPLYR